ncbi:MAG: hypothetical protein EOP82_15790 [Variovorax sp.]|nr:MAG: hypothetical protein EOP82_15790 [Variovorax sp.]
MPDLYVVLKGFGANFHISVGHDVVVGLGALVHQVHGAPMRCSMAVSHLACAASCADRRGKLTPSQEPGGNVMKGFLRHTILGGLFLVLPATLILILLARAHSSIRAAMDPFAAALPFETRMPGLWAVLALVLLSFFAGLILQLPVVRDFGCCGQELAGRAFPVFRVPARLRKGPIGKKWKQTDQSRLGRA